MTEGIVAVIWPAMGDEGRGRLQETLPPLRCESGNQGPTAP